MRYIDRRFLFPVVAATAWAQQQSPEQAAAEAAVRARAQTFFDLQVAKKYRQGEAMVADESKDAYYNGARLNIDSFSITKVEMADGNAAAEVTIKTKATVIVPAIGKTFQMDGIKTTRWKTENGEWVYVIDKDLISPFGKLNPEAGADKPEAGKGADDKLDIAAMMRAVQLDRDAVEIKRGENQTVKVSNLLPGPVDIRMENFSLPGVSGRLEKRHLEKGENTSLNIVASDAAAGSVVIVIDVSPLGLQLPIKVTVK